MNLGEVRGKEVALGLILGSSALFGIELAAVISRHGIGMREPSERVRAHRLARQPYIDQLVTSWILMAGLGITIDLTAELLAAVREERMPKLF